MKQWTDALKQALKQPAYADRLRRRCHEIQNLTLTLTNNYDQPLHAVRELGWIYPSDEELASIMLAQDDQHIYTYSAKIYEQLPKIITLLKENPNTRRAIIHLTDEEHSQQQEHQPCMVAIYAAIRDDKLHLTTYARSIDLFVGLPANLYQTSVVAKELASKLHKELGSITFLINSAHVFDDYLDELHQVLQAN